MATDLVQDVAAVLPEYEIGGELGRGAFGVVLAGRHRRLGRQVAIKLLSPGFSEHPEVRHRFSAEARILGQFDHPHIVPVFDYVEQGGLCALVMELLPGGTVRHRLRQQGVDARTACAIGLAACSALDYAHHRGVLHRDVKPDNLLLASDGLVKMTDFGIARMVGGVAVTRVGETVGTPLYMAPEQCTDQPLGPATDVYAAGLTLYELLAGRHPFAGSGDAMATMYRQIHEVAPPLNVVNAGIPEAFSPVVMRAMAKDPAARYPSARHFGAALAEAAVISWGEAWVSGDAARILSPHPVEPPAQPQYPLPAMPPDAATPAPAPAADSGAPAILFDPAPDTDPDRDPDADADPDAEAAPAPDPDPEAAPAPDVQGAGTGHAVAAWTTPVGWGAAVAQSRGDESTSAESEPVAADAWSGPPTEVWSGPPTEAWAADADEPLDVWPPEAWPPNEAPSPAEAWASAAPSPAETWPPAQAPSPAEAWASAAPSPAEAWPRAQIPAAESPAAWAPTEVAAEAVQPGTEQPMPPVPEDWPPAPYDRTVVENVCWPDQASWEAWGYPGPYRTAVLPSAAAPRPAAPSAVPARAPAAPASARRAGGIPDPNDDYRPPKWPPPAPNRTRTALVALAVAAVCLAVVAAVLLTTKKPAPATAAKTPTTVRAETPAQVAAAVSQLIKTSATARTQVVATVASIQNCSEDPQAATTSLSNAIATRQQVVHTLQTLPVAELQNGTAMSNALATALNDSAAADQSFRSWLAGITAHGGCTGQAPTDANYAAGERSSASADQAKQTFASLWNPIAATYGLPTVTSTTI